MIKLPMVTVWGCVWSGDGGMIDRTLRVLRYLRQDFKFGAERFFQPKLNSIDEFNHWHNHELPKFIHTAYALSIHDDGFPIRPDLWSREFLRYDYIGAPWVDGVVGNAGFCLQSRRLMQIAMNLPHVPVNSDTFLCRHWRRFLELKGIRFAPTNVALRFSTEQFGNQNPSFGFHGRHAAHEKFARGWHQIERFERSL